MEAFVKSHSDHGGADVVLEAAGAENTFEMAWKCAPPQCHCNCSLHFMTALSFCRFLICMEKNLTFKTGGVDGCDCEAILKLIEEAYQIFEEKKDGVIKVAVKP